MIINFDNLLSVGKYCITLKDVKSFLYDHNIQTKENGGINEVGSSGFITSNVAKGREKRRKKMLRSISKTYNTTTKN